VEKARPTTGPLRRVRRKRRSAAAILVLLLLIACFWPLAHSLRVFGSQTTLYSPGRLAIIYLIDSIADYVLTHVEVPLDFELPVTPTSYPSSAQTAAILGGRGHGLDCSLPPGASYVFRREPEWAPIAFRFRQACAFHDLCYRHGLATYGYLQNDCDELLQEHAFRICRYVFRKEGFIENCRVEAKKITLAVRLGGTDSFQGWGHSTFHEFDPFPIRSSQFSVVRLLSREADDPRGARGLDLVRFEVTRARVRATCIDCAGSVPVTTAIVPLLRRGIYAAPQLVTDESGRSRLGFVTRSKASNTAVSLGDGTWMSKTRAIALAAKAEGEEDGRGVPDLLGSTVYAIAPPGDPHAGDSLAFLTPSVECKADGRLHISLGRIAEPFSRSCDEVDLPDRPELKGDRYRWFQHPPLIDLGRRRLLLVKRGADAMGSRYDQQAHAVMMDFPRAPSDGKYRGKLFQDVPLRELHEPVALLPDESSTPVLLSLADSGGGLAFSVVETALDVAPHKQTSRDVVIGGQAAFLPRDWIDRGALLLHEAEGASLLLTRIASPQVKPGAKRDPNLLRLDVLLLRRETGPAGEPRWVDAAASRCEIAYRPKTPNPQNPPKVACLRDHEPRALPSPVNRLKGSQTLAGDRHGSGASDVVIVDPCLEDNPIVLERAPERRHWSIAEGSQQVGTELRRETVCRPARRAEVIVPGSDEATDVGSAAAPKP
jgi:hypothetical protein